MKFAVVGAGAIGSLFAGLLSRAQQDVILLTRREEAAEEIRSRGIRVSDEHQSRSFSVEATTRASKLSDREVVMLAVKSYDTEAVTREIGAYLPEDGVLLTLQNGIGNIETIRRVLPKAQLIGGSTSTGVSLLGVGRLFWAGKGTTIIGEQARRASPRTKELAKILTSSGIPTKVTSDLKRTLWRKTLINAGINPVTALLSLTNGDLLKEEEAFLIACKAIQEGIPVAKAEGVKFQTNLLGEMRVVAKRTAQNRSSMLQDLENHRRTEVDAINGAIVASGRRNSIPTPVNEALWMSIRSIESSNDRYTALEVPAERLIS